VGILTFMRRPTFRRYVLPPAILGACATVYPFLWLHWVWDVGASHFWMLILACVAAFLTVSIPASLLIDAEESGLKRKLVSAAFFALGYLWFVLLFLAFEDVTRLVIAWGWGMQLDLGGRRAATVSSAVAAIALSLFAAAKARRLELLRVPISLARWPQALDGYKIIQLSDMHLGPSLGRRFVDAVVKLANAEEPDIIVITGDLVDEGFRGEIHALEALRGLKARQGVYFVTGNHDYFRDARELLETAPAWGLNVLSNRRETLGTEAARFDLAGVNDYAGKEWDSQGPDFERALANRVRGRACVLLAHQPRVLGEAARCGVDLVLAGHNHGGQLWPFKIWVKWNQAYVAGLYRMAETTMFVSQGCGYWGPPMRLASRSEICLFTLRSSQGRQGLDVTKA
jgi:uncharacterized protein